MPPPRRRLQDVALMLGRGKEHYAFAPDPPLSLKCMLNCRARYRVARQEFVVDDAGYLILNDHQPYEIAIDAKRERGVAESFIVWFPAGWSNDVARVRREPAGALLDDPEAERIDAPPFVERYTRHDDLVSPAVGEILAAHRAGRVGDFWLEQQLRRLLARMFAAQSEPRGEPARIDGLRAATREELWRRVNRAREYIQARSSQPLSLADVARVASMSPYHLLRTFKAAFTQTPHEWLSDCRLAHAKSLLTHTSTTVTEICADVGFESLGSFSTWFARATGKSPRAWRRHHARRSQIRNFREATMAHAAVHSAVFA